MGSLAYNNNRDSISTVGTGKYLAQHAPPPLPTNGRDSIASGRSGVDSVLHGFPMIPPGQSRSRSNSNLNPTHSPIPQSTSVSTLEHIAMPSRPPTSYRSNPQTSVPAPNRNTQASVGLGGFTFLPPTGGPDDAGLPSGASDGPPTIPVPGRGRNTMGMSTTSEGLGEFDFSFDKPEPRR
jgi:hypothetical protein